MFKNILVFNLGPDWQAPSASSLESALGRQSFAHCAPTQKESIGWVHPRPVDFSPLLDTVAEQWILKLKIEKKSVPSAVIKRELDKRCKKLSAEIGRRVSGKNRKDIKDQIEFELLPRAFAKQNEAIVWLDRKNRRLVVGTTSASVADSVIEALFSAFEATGKPLDLTPLRTTLSPSSAMATWLTEKEAPDGFSIDRDLELKHQQYNSVVRYADHNLAIQEIVGHISDGKSPVSLAMTYADRISFVLTHSMALKRIALLDVNETPDPKDKPTADSKFESDVALMTSELSHAIPALVEALGGEYTIG